MIFITLQKYFLPRNFLIKSPCLKQERYIDDSPLQTRMSQAGPIELQPLFYLDGDKKAYNHNL